MLRGIKGMGVLPTAAKQHYPTQNNRRASCARETLAKITHTETEKRDGGKIRSNRESGKYLRQEYRARVWHSSLY